MTRKIDQGLRVFDVDGRYIAHIIVLGFDPGRVKIGIDADPRFVVLRDELLDQETHREGPLPKPAPAGASPLPSVSPTRAG